MSPNFKVAQVVFTTRDDSSAYSPRVGKETWRFVSGDDETVCVADRDGTVRFFPRDQVHDQSGIDAAMQEQQARIRATMEDASIPG